jgi:hypothetical protein
MPDIPGSNPIPGGSIPGRGSIPPNAAGVGGSAGAAGATGPAPIGVQPSNAEKLAKAFPKFFGFHTEASIMARLAGMGLSPSLGNLRIAQQLLRYGQGLEAETVQRLAQLWNHYGGQDVVQLEALVVLHAQGLPIDGQTLQAMAQLLSGGPLSHLLARLTMAIKADQNPKLAGVSKRLTAFWQLGHLDKDMVKQIGLFQKELAGLTDELSRLDLRGLSDETSLEVGRLNDLMDAHKLLANQGNPAQYLPFFIWREQQPLPAELVVQEEGGGGAAGAGQFHRVTLAVDTKNFGRVTVDITMIRDRLSVKFDVADEKLKKLLDSRLVLLRQKLTLHYMVDILSCLATGNSRAVSALLPSRRDLKKLRRAQGIL